MNKDLVEVVIFDLGNVILPFNHYQIAEKLSKFSMKQKDPKMIFSFLFDIENGAINPYETGKISSLEFFQIIKKSLNLYISFDEFKPIWNEIFWKDKEVSENLSLIKGKKRLFLLSNTNPLHFNHILSKFPIIKIFERWILSYEIGYKKPAPEIFQAAIKFSSIEPKRILFIDDTQKHVEVAISLGLRAIHFKSAQQLKEDLSLFL